MIKEVLRDYHFEDNSCRECAMKKMSTMSREKLVQYLLRKVRRGSSIHLKGFRMETIHRILKDLPDFR